MVVNYKNAGAELKHVSLLATSQVNAGMPPTEVAENHHACIMKKFGMLKGGTYEEVTELTNLITAESPKVGWNNDQKKALVQLVNNSLQGCSGAHSKKENQNCTTFELYLTEEENANMRDPTMNDRALVGILRNRAKLLGLHCASEPTKGRIAMIVNHIAHGGTLRGDAWYKLLRLLTDAFATLRREEWPHEYLVNFPEDPNKLSANIFKHAYPEKGPACMDILNMDCPEFLRRSSKHLRPEPASHGRAQVQPQQFDCESMMRFFGAQISSLVALHTQPSPLNIQYMNQQGSPYARQVQRDPSAGSSSGLGFQHGFGLPQGGLRMLGGSPTFPSLTPGNTPETSPEKTLPKTSPEKALPSIPEETTKKAGDISDDEDEEAVLRAAILKKKPAADEDCSEGGDDVCKTSKKPAASKSGKVLKALKKPAAAVKVKGGWPAAPYGSKKAAPARVDYKGAVIYTSWAKLSYRCILDSSKSPSDKPFTWASYGGHQKAWHACMQWIDENK